MVVNALPDMVPLREPPAGLKERILAAAAADAVAGRSAAPDGAFAGPFFGGVDAHFAAGAFIGGGVVEDVEGAVDDHGVAFGVYVGGYVEEDVIEIDGAVKPVQR